MLSCYTWTQTIGNCRHRKNGFFNTSSTSRIKCTATQSLANKKCASSFYELVHPLSEQSFFCSKNLFNPFLKIFDHSVFNLRQSKQGIRSWHPAVIRGHPSHSRDQQNYAVTKNYSQHAHRDTFLLKYGFLRISTSLSEYTKTESCHYCWPKAEFSWLLFPPRKNAP